MTFFSHRQLFQNVILSTLLDFLEGTIEEMVENEPGAAIILGGDFNQLPVVEVAARTGLTPLVHTPTRGRNIQCT